MVLRYRGGDILNFRGDLLALGHFSDLRPLTGPLAWFDWRSNASVSRLWKDREDLFRFGRMTLVASQGKVPAGGVLVAGLGTREHFTVDLRREIYRQILHSARGLRGASLAVEAFPTGGRLGLAAVEDFTAAAREVGQGGPPAVSLFVGDPDLLSKIRTGPEPEEDESVAPTQAAGE